MMKTKIKLISNRLKVKDVYAFFLLGLMVSPVFPFVHCASESNRNPEVIRIPELNGILNIRLVREVPSGLISVFGYSRRIGIIIPAKNSRSSEHLETMRSSVESAVATRGYFAMVDTSGRLERLRDIALSRSGLVEGEKEVGQELPMDGIMLVDFISSPVSECRTERVAVYRQRFKGYKWNSQTKKKEPVYENYTEYKETGVLHVKLTVRVQLSDIRSAARLTRTLSDSGRYSSAVGNRSCTFSRLEAFRRLIRSTSQDIAKQISPLVLFKGIPLAFGTEGLRPQNRERIKEYLVLGARWVSLRNYTKAAAAWERAHQISPGRSLAVNWNLAVYYWSLGKMKKAAPFVDHVALLGPRKLKLAIMNSIALFDEEFEKIEEKH